MLIGDDSLAEIEEEPFKDKHWACAAENSQWLSSQHAEHSSCQSRTHETFQHPLQHQTESTYRPLMENVRPRNIFKRVAAHQE